MSNDSLSILEATRRCLQAFRLCLTQSQNRTTSAKLENELGRLKIWAGDIGVFADGYASADYRLRNDLDVKLALVQMLRRAGKVLETYIQLSAVKPSERTMSQNTNQQAELESMASSRSSSPSLVISSESDTDSVLMLEKKPSQRLFAETHTQAVEDIIGRLYRLAGVIRRPITYTENARIAKFVRENPAARELSADLESHVRFQIQRIQIRRNEAEIEPARPPVPSFLVDRLVRAAMLRRQRFFYREHHRKLDHGSKVAPRHAASPITLEDRSTPDASRSRGRPVSNEANASQNQKNSPTTLRSSSRTISLSDTEAFFINPVDKKPKQRSGALSAVTPSVVVQREQLDVPPPPRADPGRETVTCPYCFVSLEASVTKPALWT